MAQKKFGSKSNKIRKIFKTALIAAAALFVVGVIAGISVYSKFKAEIPAINMVSDYKPDAGTKVYSYDGELIAEFYHENRRIIIPYDKIPEKLRLAFVAGEDSSFYTHKGIDPLGIIRAAFKYMTTGIKQGGSTITQQLSKSFVGTERTFSRKIKDMIMAIELEKHLSKEEILYLYLNEVYLGSGAYGVEAASRKYFSKHVWELEIDEMAILAGLPKFPSAASPILNPDKALRRRNYVLKRMFDDKYITKSEYDAALSKPITTNPQKDLFLDKAPYFSEKVRRYLLDKYGFDKLYKEGMTVQTTVDMRATKYAHEAVFYGIRELSKRQGYARGEEDSYQKGDKFGGEVTNPLYSINLKKDLETYLKRHEKTFGKITEETIKSGVYYQGVVLETKEKSALVQVGEVKREIYLEDLGWARPWSPVGSYAVVRSVKEVFKPGDVILVRATDKAGTRDQYDFRNYSKELGKDFYFVLEQIPSSQAAIIVKDPYSGYVKALMGGYDFEISEFDRTTQACRQPGSSIKPIFYTLALEKRGGRSPLLTPATMVLDAPVTVTDTNFKPANFENTFKGEVTVWEALIHSMNTPAIRVLQKLGLRDAIDGAKALGIKSEIKPEFGSMLGSSCLTIDELTDAYAHFPNMGKAPHTTYIRKIYDKNGNVLEDNTVFYDPYISAPSKLERLLHFAKRDENQVLTPQTAYITNKILEDVVNRGTAASVRGFNHYKCKKSNLSEEEEGEEGICNRHVAGKTGTTNDYFDAWFIGYSPNFVAGVWVGNDQHGRPLGRVETGSKTALPIGRDVMERYLKNFPPTSDYELPAGVVGRNIDPKTGLVSDKDGVRMYFHAGSEPNKTVEEKDVLDPTQGAEDLF
ncbi:PBP1A family penicillin-binding protein [bacterium]|nr:PBP1A family penicillin-binding protein [bacterium]